MAGDWICHHPNLPPYEPQFGMVHALRLLVPLVLGVGVRLGGPLRLRTGAVLNVRRGMDGTLGMRLSLGNVLWAGRRMGSVGWTRRCSGLHRLSGLPRLMTRLWLDEMSLTGTCLHAGLRLRVVPNSRT